MMVDMSDATKLSTLMREWADTHSLPTEHRMRALADEFDRRRADFFAIPQRCTAGTLFAAWSTARRAWCDATGEPLL